ncbi:Ribbon-helix-helix domain protein [compost metagenome]
MAEKILKSRKQISSSIRNDLWDWVQEESTKTDIPISKLLDRAIEAYKEKVSGDK